MDDYKYLLDGKPISARGLILTASRLQVSFGDSGLKTTSVAADILRRNGHKVMQPDIGGSDG